MRKKRKLEVMSESKSRRPFEDAIFLRGEITDAIKKDRSSKHPLEHVVEVPLFKRFVCECQVEILALAPQIHKMKECCSERIAQMSEVLAPHMVAAGTRLQATIHRDAAWHAGGPVRSQKKILSNLWDAHTGGPGHSGRPHLSRSPPGPRRRSLAHREACLHHLRLRPRTPPKGSTAHPFASRFSHGTHSVPCAIKSSTVSVNLAAVCPCAGDRNRRHNRWPASSAQEKDESLRMGIRQDLKRCSTW